MEDTFKISSFFLPFLIRVKDHSSASLNSFVFCWKFLVYSSGGISQIRIKVLSIKKTVFSIEKFALSRVKWTVKYPAKC